MQKGFIAFVITLAIALLMLCTTQYFENNQNMMNSTEKELIKAEMAHKERTLLENNTDTIIKTKLEGELLKKNFNPYKIQTEINSALLHYLESRASACEIISKKKNKLDIFFLNKNTSAYAFTIDGITYAEYSYVSNTQKSEIVCKILGGNILLEYQIPPGYTIKVVG
jgi:hypothetical protein